MANYNSSSPWYNTPSNNLYLDLLTIRPIPSEADDYPYTLEPQYRHRPDLLAYDLYGSSKLWWVFAQRNMDTIKDPVYDFEPGITIKIPKHSNLKRYLGI
jgi:hypothetical protein